MTDHEAPAKRIIEQARNQNEGVLIELIAAALAEAAKPTITESHEETARYLVDLAHRTTDDVSIPAVAAVLAEAEREHNEIVGRLIDERDAAFVKGVERAMQIADLEITQPTAARAIQAEINDISRTCRGCGELLTVKNWCVADGCSCNSSRGINHGLVPKAVCTCSECDSNQTGSSRARNINNIPFALLDSAEKEVVEMDELLSQSQRVSSRYFDEIVQLKAERDALQAEAIRLVDDSETAFVRGLEHAKQVVLDNHDWQTILDAEIDKAGKK